MRSSTRPTRENRPVIFLFGPTASGKTALVEGLFNHGYQIVNADSVQVYRHLSIGSAKPSSELMARIPHHLVDILEPWQDFSVASFISMADEAVDRIYADGDIPVLAGGTAFYFKHFLYGLSQAPAVDPAVRSRVAAMLGSLGERVLHERLASVDPVSAARINVHDVYRTTRALEVYEQTGRPLSSFALPSEPRLGMRPLVLSLVRDRQELYERIDRRVDQMFHEGLVDEIRSLVAMGATSAWSAMDAIGYAEFFHAFECGCKSLSMIREEIKRNTRHYAKRQLTFFNSFSGQVRIDPDDTAAARRIVEEYISSFPHC